MDYGFGIPLGGMESDWHVKDAYDEYLGDPIVDNDGDMFDMEENIFDNVAEDDCFGNMSGQCPVLYAQQIYYNIFKDPDGPFRTTFPEYVDDRNWKPIRLDNVLGEPLMSFTDEKKTEEMQETAKHEASERNIQNVPEEVSDHGAKVMKMKETKATLFMKHPEKGPGIVFPLENLIKWANETGFIAEKCDNKQELLNRKGLQKLFATHPFLSTLGISPADLFVGYLMDGEPTNTGCCLVPPGPMRDATLAAIPNARLTRLSLLDGDESSCDINAFYRSNRTSSSHANTVTTVHSESERMRKAVNKAARLITKKMSSSEKLEELVEKAGGIHKCRWVCFDFEFAYTLKGSIGLPVEVACVEVPCFEGEQHVATIGDDNILLFSLIHPGSIEDGRENIAQLLSCCNVQQHTGNYSLFGHGIPIDGATFLDTRYDKLSQKLNLLLSGHRCDSAESDNNEKESTAPITTIFINKGSTTDLHAVRWLYAASNSIFQTSFDYSLEASLEMPIFDISALEKMVKNKGVTTSASDRKKTPVCRNRVVSDSCSDNETDEEIDSNVNESPTSPLAINFLSECCWYHFDAVKWFEGCVVHCALSDATKLAYRVTDLLKELRN